MARLSIFRVDGDPDELVPRMETLARDIAEREREHGILARILARTDSGVVVVNLWRSADGSDAMAADPVVQDALRRAGFGGRPPERGEHYDVTSHNLTG
jgi:hypothetical protein